MHQYTADLANRTVSIHEIHLVTTESYPSDRYHNKIAVHCPVSYSSTGLSVESLNPKAITSVKRKIEQLSPDIVHFTGPHLWNLYLVNWLRKQNIPVIHTLHDMDPHIGVRNGRMLKMWNRFILNNSSRVLVHNKLYLSELLEKGLQESQLMYFPLLHLFISHHHSAKLMQGMSQIDYEPFALFFGRIEQYKGIDTLLESFEWLHSRSQSSEIISPKLVMAGSGKLPERWVSRLPSNVEVRNRFIADKEAIDLFSRCSLVVLPYIGATQSAIVASAYFFYKPVIISKSGALEEYALAGRTGFLVNPGDSLALAKTLENAFSPSIDLEEMGLCGRGWYDKNREEESFNLFKMYRET